MPIIHQLTASEILDSRGRPTLKATCRLASGAMGTASVPSGASTGSSEALELRDGDPRRYRGLGTRHAADQVNGEMNGSLAGRAFETSQALDEALIALDGTPDKRRLGANAILAVSLAFARAFASERRQPLYEYFRSLLPGCVPALPRPTINLFSGGKHAGGQVPIQDVLVVPVSATSIDESLAMVWEVFQCAAELTRDRYHARPLRADEGGLAPPFKNSEAMLEDAVEAIRLAGFEPGREVALAVDVASSHFFWDGAYHLGADPKSAAEMIGVLEGWLQQFPIISLEDGLAENDWDHWPDLRKRVAGRALVLGDDLLCTNPARIRRAIEAGACDALLLKVNQIGTLSEAAEACRLARGAGWQVTVSARSGETEDDWLADLAVGWAGDQIKIGSITQSERLAKYNRLLEIERTSPCRLRPWRTK